MTAAVKETPEMELKSGSWESTNWAEANIMMK
jgi:hypothetical protein